VAPYFLGAAVQSELGRLSMTAKQTTVLRNGLLNALDPHSQCGSRRTGARLAGDAKANPGQCARYRAVDSSTQLGNGDRPSFDNRPGRNRTCNPRFWRPVLYQLSYGPKNCCGWKLQNPVWPWKTGRLGRPVLYRMSCGPRNRCDWKLQNPERSCKARCLPLVCRCGTVSLPRRPGRLRR
jgi:hypothetical protein